MTPQQLEQTIREYIDQVVHMSLATTYNNKPWVCEVHFAYDNDLNLYFRSETTRRHSLEIELNPNVAGNIITQHFKNQRVRGVYFEGHAELLEAVDAGHPAYDSTLKRFGAGRIQATTKDSAGPRYYKITVSNWYLFDSYGQGPAEKHQLIWTAER
jgi:uncharacterized protein YhbP (UPF0306 family)